MMMNIPLSKELLLDGYRLIGIVYKDVWKIAVDPRMNRIQF